MRKKNKIEIIEPIAKLYLNNTDKIAIIDSEDVQRVQEHVWYIKKGVWQGYVRTAMPNHKEMSLHRFLLGVTDSRIHIDHINGDILDNRKSNLRKADNRLNHANQRLRKDNKVGYKGVCCRNGKFYARIGPAGKINLGAFPTAEEAAKAYDAKAKELYGEYAKLNFPEDAIATTVGRETAVYAH